MQSFDFVNRANAEYIDRLYEQYRRDPRSVDDRWQTFFAGFEVGLDRSGEGGGATSSPTSSDQSTSSVAVSGTSPRPEGDIDWSTAGIFDLVHSYRELGHFVATLDPLGHDRPNHPLLDLSNFGITSAHLDRPVSGGSFSGWTGGTVRELVEKLRATYCRTLGVEFTNIADKAQRDWLIGRMEPILNKPSFSQPESRALLFQLIAAEEFERYLHTRYIGKKRFSIEGGEALIPLLNTIVEECAVLGGEKVIVAMAHRGRLNALAHVLNKPYEVLLSEFEETNLPPDTEGDGDVKYHLGYASTRPLPNNKKVKVSLLPNPSHLELIDPIQQGIVRCQQEIAGDKDRTRVLPITIHGDASFTGQGVVFETLNLSELPGFRTGGTIHIIVNNQIGFTTPPRQGRFTPYPTDVAKAIQAPIFHVNGDDPEAVVWAAKLAIGFRQQFKCDVFIDMWCYRRHGHNETDEPEFTQPIMYRQIKAHKTTRQLYVEKLVEEKRITQADAEAMKNIVVERLDQARGLAQEMKPRMKVPAFGGVWKGYGKAGADWTAKTGITKELLKQVAERATAVPETFTPHPKLVKLLATRREMINTGKGIDWGCAEMLAFGSLLLEGTNIRFSGQDVERGTFSHRHAVLHDYKTGDVYTPLQHMAEKQAKINIRNTMLSEFATLGFEWGYGSADPRNLVLWEAQFGDFVNGAQPVIDQIIVSAESKWRYMNGMVMLLPHGYEGQGPEHSNAYIERFLGMCADENIQVIIPSTPANYFHALRRQIHRKFRKPLISFMPKAVLRMGASTVEDLIGDTQFQLIIDDPATQPTASNGSAITPQQVKRLILCSGKVYFTLATTREKEKVTDTAIVRVEQPYPFPQKELAAIFAKYRGVTEVEWVQEEPKNRGCWSFIHPRLQEILPPTMKLTYVGREAAASPSTGIMKMHEVEEQEILQHSLHLTPKKSPVATEVKPAAPAVAQPAAVRT